MRSKKSQMKQRIKEREYVSDQNKVGAKKKVVSFDFFSEA